MKPEIVSVPAFTLVGTKYHGKNQNREIPAMWENQFLPRVGEIKNQSNPFIFYGVLRDFDCATGEFDYVAGVEVNDTSDIPEGMVSWVVPAQTYAIFPCTLPTLFEAFGTAKEWLMTSDYTRGDGPEFEHYGRDFPEGQKISVYVPIARK